ncbi:hypothetical protein GPECTOR_52g70 [Gonium pectorale]|uniref:C2 domain-containing protein n=1 Tax=Gonium pectorale TaxID=33097 RepID=A0A150G7D1_GONPE|nr:hypothetical protein GPECTOR_52g70 [Gonium pectorale]|eukprot:KXZ45673.1 hypothetical protein GPECTOR_52g70 [Gonium pectorale]
MQESGAQEVVQGAFLASRYTHVLEVRLHGASGLPASDVSGTASPYAKLTATCGEDSWCTISSSVKPTLSPTWNETLYLCLRNPEPKALMLTARVYDKDCATQDDLLGESETNLAALAAASGDGSSTLQEYKLALKGSRGGDGSASINFSCRLISLVDSVIQEADGTSAAAAAASPAWLRFLRTSVGKAEDLYSPEWALATAYSGVLEVHVQCASGLPASDLTGKADPFVQLLLESGRNGEAWDVRSSIKHNTLDPEWREVYYLRAKDAGADSLRVRVYDKDWFRKELMGEAVLRLADLKLAGGKALVEVPVQLQAPGGKAGAGTVTLQLRLWQASSYDPEECADAHSLAPTSAVLGELTPVAYVDCQDTDTQAWLYRNMEVTPPIVVIAFRGTQMDRVKDVFTDLGLLPTRWNDEAHDGLEAEHEEDETKTKAHEEGTVGNKTTAFQPAATMAAKGKVHDRSGQLVHGGFHFSYDSVRDTVFGLLDEIRATRPGPWRVLVTGHSLGGALATLGAYELAELKLPADPPVVMYTYGAPRVGNKAFAEAFNALVPDAFRCANDDDIVPRVPRLMGFCHVGTPVLLAEGKPPAVGVNPEECIEGKWLYQIFGEVVRGAFQMSPFEVLGKFTKPGKALLWSLFTGKGVTEHLGNYYRCTLTAALELQGALSHGATAAVQAAMELPHKAAVMVEAVALAATDSLKTALSKK